MRLAGGQGTKARHRPGLEDDVGLGGEIRQSRVVRIVVGQREKPFAGVPVQSVGVAGGLVGCRDAHDVRAEADEDPGGLMAEPVGEVEHA